MNKVSLKMNEYTMHKQPKKMGLYSSPLEDEHLLRLYAIHGEEAPTIYQHFLLDNFALDNQTIDARVKFGGLGSGLLPRIPKSFKADILKTCYLINELFHFLYFLSYLFFTLRIIHYRAGFVKNFFQPQTTSPIESCT